MAAGQLTESARSEPHRAVEVHRKSPNPNDVEHKGKRYGREEKFYVAHEELFMD